MVVAIKKNFLLLVLPILISGILWNFPALVAAQQLSDQDISDAVEGKIAVDRVVPVDRIGIETLAGTVKLTGTVDTLLAKERALRLAQTVRGVQSVVNTIVVKPVHRTDADIHKDVTTALSGNPAIASRNLTVNVKESIVTISGEVTSWPEQDVAIKLAKSVTGVKEVQDEIVIRYPETRTDQDIMNDVVQALRWDAMVARNRIMVDVSNGRVKLSGSVGSAAEKVRASNLSWTAGVKDVDASRLEVTTWRKPDDRENVVVTDDQIRKAVEMALLVDPRTNPFKINVEVKGRVVTLRGIVETLAAKRAAEEDSRNTYKVMAVKNRLKVNPNQEIQDVKIAESVRDALAKHARLNKYQINVGVVGGIAYLSGTVPSVFDKATAEFTASQIKGVVDVNNGLVVVHGTPYIYDPFVDEYFVYRLKDSASEGQRWTDELLLFQGIRNQLFWSPFVDADQVKVSVDGMFVTLTGTVDSQYEKDIAAKNAFDGGAPVVINKLQVK